MGIKTIITYKNKKFVGFHELVNFYNKNKSGLFNQSVRNIEAKYRKFLIKNKRKPNDSELKSILVTRTSKNYITYKNKIFKGPKELYKYLKNNEISYSAFHRNLIIYKKNNNKIPNDKIIESLNKKNKINKFKDYWSKYNKEKIGWSFARGKVKIFKDKYSKEPSKAEFLKFIKPVKFKWLAGNRDNETSIVEFYKKQKIEKISFGGFSKRVLSFRKRNNRYLKYEEAISLLKSWGKVNSIAGYLYKYVNLKNKKVYIGITSQTIKERHRGHLRNSIKKGINKYSIDYAINKDGIKNFKLINMGEFDSFKKLADAEKYYIKKYNSLCPNGYNIDKGGRGLGLKKYPIEFNGKFYNNLVAIAADYNVPYKRLESRLRLGFNLEDSISNAKFLTRKRISEGFTKTIPEYAKQHNISPKKVYERLKRGWSLEEAIEIKKRQIDLSDRYNSKKITIDGKIFSSQSSAAKFYGLTHQTFFKRIKRGWTIRQALGLEKRKRTRNISRI